MCLSKEVLSTQPLQTAQEKTTATVREMHPEPYPRTNNVMLIESVQAVLFWKSYVRDPDWDCKGGSSTLSL